MDFRDKLETDISLIVVVTYIAYIFLVIGACILVTNLCVNSLNPKQYSVHIDPHTLQLTIRHGKNTWVID